MGAMARMIKSAREDEDDDWDIPTSMIDVVFLLLIFFMCASKFRVLERRLDAFLPKDKGPSSMQTVVRQLDEIVVYVTALESHGLRVPEFRIRNLKMHDPNKLAQHLAQLKSIGDMPVVIDGRPLCPFRHVMSALDACARAGLTKVEFRPPPAQDGGGDDRHYKKL
jgi:biopolymer transport protein ExbD